MASSCTDLTLRVPGDLFRAMGVLYLRWRPNHCREALARELRARLKRQGMDYHVRTLKRQLTGQVATVPPPVEAALRHLLTKANPLREDADIDRALARAGLGVAPEQQEPAYVSTARIVPLAQLWLLLNPARSKRSLATAVQRSLAREGIRVNVDPLQRVLAGRQPRARRQVYEQLLALLSTHGIDSESDARAQWEQHRDQIAAYQQQRVRTSSDRLAQLARVWKQRCREPSSRRLAALLGSRLAERGVYLGLRRVQEALEGKGKHVRAALVMEMERLLREALPKGRELEQAVAQSNARTVRQLDLCWVQAEPIAALAAAWLEQHPRVSMRQLCLRVANTARRMGYRSSLNTIQPILGGRTRRTRGFVYRAMLRQFGGARKRIPEAQVLPSLTSSTAPVQVKRGRDSRQPRSAASNPCCARPRTHAGASGAFRYAGRLTRADEVVLAQRIEAADRRLQTLLLRCAIATKELARIAGQLQEGQLEARDVFVGARPMTGSAEGWASSAQRRALSEVAELEALCEPVRKELLRASITERRALELREQLEVLWSRMAAAFGDLRLGGKLLRLLRERYRALLEQAEKAAEGQGDEARTAVRRIEQQLGLPLDEMRRTWNQLVTAAREAARLRDEMVRANQHLVLWVARKYRWQGLDLADLVAEGNIGLLSAVERYDYRRGCRFSTYATWWIRARLERAISEIGRNIRVPGNVAGRLRRLRKAATRAYQERGSCPALRDLATDAGLRPDDVRGLLLVDRGTISMQAPIGRSGATLEDVLADRQTALPLEGAEQQELSSCLTEALTRLESREAYVLRLRYGLRSGRTYTLAEIASRLGVSRERVRQIQEHALEHLREAQDAPRLKALLDEHAPAA